MNAHAVPVAAPLSALAVQNADLLRALRTGGHDNLTALAASISRDRSNTRRSIATLQAEALVAGDDHTATLTPAGLAQLAAIERAEGAGEDASTTGPLVAWRKLRLNPENPREHFDEDEIDGLATSIAEKGVLHNLVVDPADAEGVHAIQDGDRRYLAIERLITRGEASGDFLVPIAICEREPGDAELVALIANGQRQDMSGWEEAGALSRLAEKKGWSARECARRTGRARQGSETGVRDVQEKIKVARQAKPEDVALYKDHHAGADCERHGCLRPHTWEWLRDTVRAKAPATSSSSPAPPPRHVVGELTGLETQRFLEVSGRMEAMNGPGPHGYLILALTAEQVTARDLQLRDKHAIELRPYQENPKWPWGIKITDAGHDWLRRNGRAPAAAAPPIGDTAQLDIEEVAPRPVEDTLPSLEPGDQLALVELAHKCAFDPAATAGAAGEQGRAAISKFWLHASANRLQELGLIARAGGPAGWVAWPTARGVAWLEGYGIDNGPPLLGDCHASRVRAGMRLEEAQALDLSSRYSTAWLNVEAGEAEVPPAEDPAPAEPVALDPAEVALSDRLDALDEITDEVRVRLDSWRKRDDHDKPAWWLADQAVLALARGDAATLLAFMAALRARRSSPQAADGDFAQALFRGGIDTKALRARLLPNGDDFDTAHVGVGD